MTANCSTCNEITDFTFVGEDPNTGADIYQCMVCEERVEIIDDEKWGRLGTYVIYILGGKNPLTA